MKPSLIEKKNQNPNDIFVDYEIAIENLKIENYPEFIKHAEYFLFRSNEFGFYQIMTHYNLSRVHYLIGNSENALKHILICLANQPVCKLFWETLSEYYSDTNKAKVFREIASLISKEEDYLN